MNTSWEKICGNTTINDVNITDTVWPLCATAASLAGNTRLKITLAIRATVSIIGLILFVLLFKAQGTYLAYHANARVQMLSHHFWAICTSLSNLLAITVTVIHFLPDYACPCDYLTTALRSIPSRVWIGICIYGQVYTFVIMTVERIVATVRYRTYESSKATLGYVLIAIQFLLTAFCTWLVLSRLNTSELKAYPSTSSTATNAVTSVIYQILIAVEIVCFLIFYGLLYLNKRYKKINREASLTEKYQIDENIRAIYLLMPMVITHFCIFVPAIVALPIYTTYINPLMEARDYTLFAETANITYMYSAVLPLVLFWRHKALRESLRRSMNINEIFPDGMRADGRTHEQARHFQILQQMWLPPSH